jgi:hypothetical protein
MELKEAAPVINADLPSSFKHEKTNSYMIKWTYKDTAGDEATVEIDSAGRICTFEIEPNGTEWTTDALDFLWRASRIVRDLPW